MQHFDRCIRTEMDMFTQVDLRKATFSKQANKLIVTQPLSHTIGHLLILLYGLLHWLFVDLTWWLHMNQGFRRGSRFKLLLFDGWQACDHRASFPQRRKRRATV